MNTLRMLPYQKALEAVTAKKVLVYPTETLYALGCDATDAGAVAEVFRIKGREASKAVPLIIGDVAQIETVARLEDVGHSPCSPPCRDPQQLLNAVQALAERFWPGPLTLVLPAAPGLPEAVLGPDGCVAVRLSAHAEAARLSRESGVPLVATSANRSGEPAAATPGELDPAVVADVTGCFAGSSLPGGGLPSTLVRPACRNGSAVLEVLRHGAVPAGRLAEVTGLPVR